MGVKKNILVVDDSALMRRVVCDIINADENFVVADIAKNGVEALTLLTDHQYDAVVLDINMPRMTGLELLEKLQKLRIKANIIMNSTLTKDGAAETIKALELGAIDFVTKPENFIAAKGNDFKTTLLTALNVAAGVKIPRRLPKYKPEVGKRKEVAEKPVNSTQEKEEVRLRKGNAPTSVKKGKVIALACSTGGPKSLQSVIPLLPANLSVPMLVVQHMPAGFTKSLADRLNDVSKVKVVEAADGEVLKPGCVYIAPGGKHLQIRNVGGQHKVALTDEPTREGVKPCANYMYESLADSSYEEIICVVLTGMGADGTKGIKFLDEKKKTYVIAQDEKSSVVYGMPKAIAETGLVDEVVPLTSVTEAILKNLGV
ncbi:MAG: chemotaxis-specific protein-glutamate methyltransferase CheB [Lachnospiraceae bacterium]|nr:chemotaxis-specific protein-glutamate methyltransferase CheB [Lachnospiraceae bacterium]